MGGNDPAAMLHDFLRDDNNLKQINDAVYRQDWSSHDPNNSMIQLSLDSYHQDIDHEGFLNPEKGKRDVRLNKKF